MKAGPGCRMTVSNKTHPAKLGSESCVLAVLIHAVPMLEDKLRDVCGLARVL